MKKQCFVWNLTVVKWCSDEKMDPGLFEAETGIVAYKKLFITVTNQN